MFKKSRSPIDQADEVCEIMLAAARSERSTIEKMETDPAVDKKKSILKLSVSLFADKGFDKTRITDIATGLNIGEASIYEYFKNKEDILFNIPVEKTESLVNAIKAKLDNNRKGEQELREFVREYLAFMQENKNYTAILLFELRSNRRFYISKAYHVFKEFNDVLIDLLKRGQDDGSFRKDINIYLVRHMIFGSFEHLALTWLLFGKPANLLTQSEHLIWLFLKSLTHPRGKTGCRPMECQHTSDNP
ncbi:MAG: TetR/AcrR family transcriptional regulator [Desulfatirhabdiaceae bacterium]